MKKRHSHIAFAWLALLLFMLGGYLHLPAQTEFVNFEAYHISQGQNPNMIADLIQDRQGFLWVSTWDGLYRYDGYQFKKYHLDSVPVLQQFPYLSSTGELLEDQDGNIWVANTYARGGSYAKFHVLDSKQGTFFVFDFSIVASPWNFNRTFLQDHLGNIWVRSTDGLRKISKSNHYGKKYAVELFNSTAGDPQSLKDDTISSILPARNNRLWIATKTGLHYYDYKESRIFRLENIKEQAPIAGLCALPSGNIALGTKGNGLFILDSRGNILDHYSALHDKPNDLNDPIVKTMLADANGQLWLITTGLKGERFTLQRFDPNQKKFFSHYLPPFESVGFLGRLMDEPFYLFPDKDGTVWMNNSIGLYHYHPGEDQFKKIESPESMSWRSGVAFLRERGGVLWIGTAGNGLLKYAPSVNQFTVFQHQPRVPESISSNAIYNILEDRNGRLWVATQDAGADRLTLDADNQITEVVHYSSRAPIQHRIPSDNISGMTEDADGNIWLCTPLGSKGIHLLTGNVIPGRQFPLQLEEKNEIGERGVRFFQTDSAGGFWAITLKHELIYWNRRTKLLKKFPVDPKIPEALISNQISAFFIDSHDDVWVGTRQGLCRYNRTLGHFKRYLEGESINDLYRAHNELLWVTIHGGGLVLLDLSAGKILKRYGLKNGFPSNAPKGILPDHAGKLWMGSDRGLIVFDPSTGQSHLFDQSSGLPSEDFYFAGGCIRRNGEFAMP
ncbi:MAG: hypothetical protein L6Q97_11685, partial [Thermoanaerobaculia bacterium]|nr:hypothetical protein [Thermoanaerobaculia bacterium]